jgi:hypothetical protein
MKKLDLIARADPSVAAYFYDWEGVIADDDSGEQGVFFRLSYNTEYGSWYGVVYAIALSGTETLNREIAAIPEYIARFMIPEKEYMEAVDCYDTRKEVSPVA